MSEQRLYVELFDRQPIRIPNISQLLSHYPTQYEKNDQVKNFTTISNPSRSEFLTALSFLSLVSKRDDEIICLGFIPAHIRSLARLFPQLQFRDRYQRHGQKRRILLGFDLRDLRNYSNLYLNDDKISWALFSFHPNGEFLDGELLIPPYNDNFNPKIYLIPNEEKKKWNLKTFEDQIFSFNISDRMNNYPQPLPEFDQCYDHSLEYHIWELYFLHQQEEPTKGKILFEMSNRI